MGPSTIVDGDLAQRTSGFALCTSFNGAVDDRRRRRSAKTWTVSRNSGFNGAVDDRRRRQVGDRAVLVGRIASMGPSTIVDGDQAALELLLLLQTASMGPSTIV